MTRKLILLLLPITLSLLGPVDVSTHMAHAGSSSYPVLADFAKSEGDLFFVSGDHTLIHRHRWDGVYLGTFGSDLSWPSMMAFSPSGEMYVTTTNSLTVLDIEGNTVRVLPMNDHESGLTFDPDGKYYVATAGAINIFDKNDQFVRSIEYGWITGQGGLAFGPDGLLYSGDHLTNSVHAIDLSTGEMVKTISGGGLNDPWGIAFRPSGEMYVNGLGSNRVHKYDADGNFLYTLEGGYQRHPRGGIAFDSRGHLFVTFWMGRDWKDGHVDEWDENDNYVGRVRNLFGGRGAVVEAQFFPIPRDNAIETHSGVGRRQVPVAITLAGELNGWEFGAINGMGHFTPSWQIRHSPANGGVYRLGFRNRFGPSVIIPIDDSRVRVESWREQPDGTFRTLGFTLDADGDGTPEMDVTLQVKNLVDSLEAVHLNATP